MEATSSEIDGILHLLDETPDRIAAFSRDLNDDQLTFKPNEKSWSANEILPHLRGCADVWGDTIERMLAEDDPKIRYISPRTWVKKTDYLDLAFQESFAAFQRQREELLHVLAGLAFEQWSRGAMIKNRRHTVFSQARRMALHEVTHLEQLEALQNYL